MADSKGDAIMGGHFATNSLENPLWRYACQVYSQPGVEAALLKLQDEYGADINLILQALWLASEGQEWTRACIPNDYEQWMTEQILPLRKMRRNMKTEWVEKRGTQYEDFRQQVKALELKAEQYALAMLFVSYDKEEKSEAGLVISNLDRLAEFSGFSFETFDQLLVLV